MPLRALARVNLAAIERNVALLCGLLTDGAGMCAVVKANGYGHGAAPAAKAALAGGASWLAVATAEEAADLRAEGIDARILVMGAISLDELPAALGARADLVAWDERFLDELARAGANRCACTSSWTQGWGGSGRGTCGKRSRSPIAWPPPVERCSSRGR